MKSSKSLGTPSGPSQASSSSHVQSASNAPGKMLSNLGAHRKIVVAQRLKRADISKPGFPRDHKVRDQKTRDLYSAAALAFAIFAIGLGLGLATMSFVDIALVKYLVQLFVLGRRASEARTLPWPRHWVGCVECRKKTLLYCRHCDQPVCRRHAHPAAHWCRLECQQKDGASRCFISWRGRCLPGALLFYFTPGKFETTFKRASFALNLQSLQLVPLSLRHGGPSTDVYLGLRTLAVVQRRSFSKSAEGVMRSPRNCCRNSTKSPWPNSTPLWLPLALRLSCFSNSFDPAKHSQFLWILDIGML
jgi:hypothetical protein